MHFDVAEEDMHVGFGNANHDRPQAQMQTVPATNVYVQVNADEADRILIDPAYKLEKLKEVHEKAYAMFSAYKICNEQMKKHELQFPITLGREQYESWYNIELAIRKFDRIFNRVEKFDARKFNDPNNHERREKRMLDRKRKRQVENFTYFMGGLTEEEAQYKDYFETDLENDPEDDYLEEKLDKVNLAISGEFDPKQYDFVDAGLMEETHENYEDIVEDKLFKFRYRQNADAPAKFAARQ